MFTALNMVNTEETAGISFAAWETGMGVMMMRYMELKAANGLWLVWEDDIQKGWA